MYLNLNTDDINLIKQALLFFGNEAGVTDMESADFYNLQGKIESWEKRKDLKWKKVKENWYWLGEDSPISLFKKKEGGSFSYWSKSFGLLTPIEDISVESAEIREFIWRDINKEVGYQDEGEG